MTTTETIIKSKLRLLELANTSGSVMKACKIMGYSCDRFYRFKKIYETGGAMALQDLSRRKPNLKNRVIEGIENAVVNCAFVIPTYGQLRVSNELRRNVINVSPPRHETSSCATISKPSLNG